MKFLLPLAILVALIWYGVARFLKPPKRTTPPVPPVNWPPAVTPSPPLPTVTPVPPVPAAIAKERRSGDEIKSLERGFAGGKLPEKDRRAGKKPPIT